MVRAAQRVIAHKEEFEAVLLDLETETKSFMTSTIDEGSSTPREY
jgi:hypothetical protein